MPAAEASGRRSRVCVFTGSSPGARPGYADAARALGATLAARGHELVYGGASVGLMGVLADSVLAAGGRAIGVIPQPLVAKEVAHPGLSELRVVGSMHERKALMASLADAFVALPGGFGTLDELFEALTWAQLGLHAKPCGLLNVDGYYDHLLAFLDHVAAERFLPAKHRTMLMAASAPDELLDRFAAVQPTVTPKWIDRESS